MNTLLSVYCLDCAWHHGNKEKITIAYLFTDFTVAQQIEIQPLILIHIPCAISALT